jgi:hypothetical protein
VTSFCHRLLQRLAFSESRHFSWDNDPANTMVRWLMTALKVSWRVLGERTKRGWSEKYDNYFKCMLLAFTQDLLRCHEPEVSVEADTSQLRNVSLADTV